MESEHVRQQDNDRYESMQRELNDLSQRLARIESLVARLGDHAPGQSEPAADASPTTLSDELVAVLSGAIAAYLGVKPHIRQIRLVEGASWAQQGRATIQASHSLARMIHEVRGERP